MANKSEVSMPYSKFKLAILEILQAEGYLKNVQTVEEGSKKTLTAARAGFPLAHVKQISKPGRRVYVKSKDIPRPLRGLGLVILSTSQGLTTSKEAIKKGLGGELICEIW